MPILIDLISIKINIMPILIGLIVSYNTETLDF
jgi:hypothetical protein